MFSVYDLCAMFTDPNFQSIVIYDVPESGVGKEVFSGTAEDAMLSDYRDYEIQSIDTLPRDLGTLTINICSDPD